MSIKQLRNGDLVVANHIVAMDLVNWANTKYGYYIACLDSAGGMRNWERTFMYADSLSGTKAIENIVDLTELPNGDLSFIASYSDTASIYFRKSSKVINFVTDNIGRPKKITSYREVAPAAFSPTLFASSASDAGHGERVVLMDNADASFLMHLDASGTIKWQKGYAKTGRSQETKSVISTSNGNYFFSFTHNGGSTDLTLVKTDSLGNVDCVQTPFSLVEENASAVFKEWRLGFKVDQVQGVWYPVIAVGAGDYHMIGTVDCKKTCCTEVIDTAIDLDVCNSDSYALPDDYIVNVSGNYQISYKTASGCDSIVYYNIRFSKTPSVDLGPAACLDGKDSMVLKGPIGYSHYNWNGIMSNNSTRTIRQPGRYILTVANGCGTGADTIEVYQKCEFEVFVPSAFSPNHDQHNDYFKLPSLNKNKLIRLSIFNRWGQMIYSTTDANKGWDGTFSNAPQPTGIYIYSLEMETLDGKRISKKGTVVLVR